MDAPSLHHKTIEKGAKGSGWSRPPPTSPKGHPKKKARREGAPPRTRDWPRDGGEPSFSRLPPISRPPPPPPPVVEYSKGEEEEEEEEEQPRDSKPLQLGGYAVKKGPSASPELKIRGRSVTVWDRIDRDFALAGNRIFAHIDDLQCFARDSSYPGDHPIPLATSRVRTQMHELVSVYRGMTVEVDDVLYALQQATAREYGLRRELEEARAANIKLTCVKEELNEQASGLKSVAEATEARFCQLKRQFEDLEARHEKLETKSRELQQECEKATAEKLELKDSLRTKDEEMQVAQAEHRRLRSLLEQRGAEFEGLKSGVGILRGSFLERGEEIGKQKAENSRLQSLVRERDAEVEGLKSHISGLERSVLERDAEIGKQKAENMRLENLVRAKESQLALLPTLPITPQSPMVPALSAPSTVLIDQASSQHVFPTTPDSLPAFIKPEPPDPTSTSPPPNMPQESTPIQQIQQIQDPVQQLHMLSTGITNLLSRMFHIDYEVTCNDVLIGFLSRLGGTPAGFSINITQAAGFWELKDSWEPCAITPRVLPSSLEEHFILLSLLFPFPGDQPSLMQHESASTFSLLASLLSSLIKADYSASPRAGLTFLQAMSAYHPQHSTAAAQEPLPTRTALLAIVFCELCRALEHTYWPNGPCPKRNWNIGSILGVEAQDAAEKLPIGWLAAALRDTNITGTSGSSSGGGVNNRVEMVKERLKAGGPGGGVDRFCVFSMPVPSTASGEPTSALTQQQHLHLHQSHRLDVNDPAPTLEGTTRTGRRENSSGKDMGLLHCGDSSCSFLVLDFGERSLRLVDCRLAWMRPNEAEPRKLDLVVSRSVAVAAAAAGEQQQAGEELMMRIEAAPRGVAASWLKYALEDV
ncbi:uncharacterized protein B0T15DRAFT_552133 [Chaetomium strumarium]|uniref:Uncharacterized protein n=1 Tax=Chaetomium strumarium TaxID=1170767 RepID=A0AAJ0GUM0_9PEZI|nr:hypothetical protein B0T15DRAFT_552133 [Chaetomium strumarium]